MSDVFSLFEEEAANPQAFDKVGEDGTKRLSSLIRQTVDLDKQVKDAEQYLKDLQYKKRTIDEEDIPSLMEELGVQSLTVDGNKVSVEKFVSARIPEDKKAEAFNFLRSIGEADIIKNEVVVQFGMGQDNVAGAVLDDLSKQGLESCPKNPYTPNDFKDMDKEQNRRWSRGRFRYVWSLCW